MFFFPYGLDDARVSRMPWVSIGILGACVAAFLATDTFRNDADLAAAAQEILAFAAEHPHLDVPPRATAVFGDQARAIQGRHAAGPEPATSGRAEAQRNLDELWESLLEAFEAKPMRRLALVPARGLVQPGWLTHLFLHAGWMHLLGNMFIFFFICAPFLEDAWGRGTLAGLYLAGGLFAGACQALPDPSSNASIVGASGAISACLGAFAVRFADRHVRVAYVLVLPVIRFGTFLARAWVWALVGLAGDLLGLALGGVHSGVAYAAHVGGFLFGVGFAWTAGAMGWERRRLAAEGGWERHPEIARAEHLVTQGKPGQARASYRKAIEGAPGDLWAWLGLARLEVAEKRWGEACRALERMAGLGREAVPAAIEIAGAIEPAQLRAPTALKAAEAIGIADVGLARRLLALAVAAGGAVGARALLRAAELEREAGNFEDAAVQARAAAASPVAPAELVGRARQLEEEAAQRIPARAVDLESAPAPLPSPSPRLSSPPDPAQERAQGPGPRPPVIYCRLLGMAEDALELEDLDGRRTRLPIRRILGIAVGAVDRVDAFAGKTVLLTELRLDAPPGQVPVRLRLPLQWLGLADRFPGVAPPEAHRRFVEQVMRGSGATPLPAPSAVAGPWVRFPDESAFERACDRAKT